MGIQLQNTARALVVMGLSVSGGAALIFGCGGPEEGTDSLSKSASSEVSKPAPKCESTTCSSECDAGCGNDKGTLIGIPPVDDGGVRDPDPCLVCGGARVGEFCRFYATPFCHDLFAGPHQQFLACIQKYPGTTCDFGKKRCTNCCDTGFSHDVEGSGRKDFYEGPLQCKVKIPDAL